MSHTPGPWLVNIEETDARRWGFVRAGDPLPGATEGVALACVTRSKPKAERDANARLIAAAPDGLREAKACYLFLLWAMPNDMRGTLEAQARLCGLRDYIARATGRSQQDVQDEYESRAAAERMKP